MVRYREVDAACPADELAELAAPAAGLFCLLSERVDAALLETAQQLAADMLSNGVIEDVISVHVLDAGVAGETR